MYRKMVGTLVYLRTCTRPYLYYIVSKLSEKLETPTVAHYKTCKFVLRCLKDTSSKGLVYRKNKKDIDLVGYCDSN